MVYEQWLTLQPRISPDHIASHAHELNLLLDSEALFYQHRDLPSLWEQCVTFAADLMVSPYAVLYEGDPDRETLVIRAAHGFQGVIPQKVSPHPSLAERVWRASEGNVLILSDLTRAEVWSTYPFGRQPLAVLSARIQVLGQHWGVLQVARPSTRPYTSDDARLLRLLTRRVEQAIPLVARQSAPQQRLLDPVTQLSGRALFQTQFQQMLQRARRLNESISLLLVDVDDLQAINREYGYSAGDQVLREIASVIRGTIRMEDLLARHHSDELLVGLPGADKQGARIVAERIQQALAQHPWHLNGQVMSLPAVSVSGVTCPEDGTTAEVLMQTAEEALLQQKARRPELRMYLRQADPERVTREFNIRLSRASLKDPSWDGLTTDLLWLGMALAAGAVESERASVMLLDPEGKHLLLRAGKGFGEELARREIQQDVGQGIAGKVAATGQPVLLTDVLAAGYTSPYADRYRTRSCLSVPIRNGRVFGILNLSDKRNGQPFDRLDLETVSQIAGAIAAPLHSPRVPLVESAANMCRALEHRFPELTGHSDRVAACAVQIGRELGLAAQDLQHLREAGWLHDLGEFEIRPRVFVKGGNLVEADWIEIRRHPEWGHDLCDAVRFLRGYRHTIRQHHERPDGTGYPDGRTIADLSLDSRVLAVAEAFIGMRSPRAYRPALTIQEALRELQEHAGTRYDEESVTALTHLLSETPSEQLPQWASPD